MSVYALNRLMYDLREPANRDAIRSDPEGYLDRYELTAEEKSLLRDRDWQGLVDAGASIYSMTKIGAALGVSLYQMGAGMRGMSEEEFWAFVAEQDERNRQYAILP